MTGMVSKLTEGDGVPFSDIKSDYLGGLTTSEGTKWKTPGREETSPLTNSRSKIHCLFQILLTWTKRNLDAEGLKVLCF